MPITNALISGKVVIPGTETGVRVELTATPLAKNAFLTWPSENITSLGSTKVETGDDGAIPPAGLAIPLDSSLGDELLWSITARPLDRKVKVWVMGAFEITADIDLADLVPVDFSVYTPAQAAAFSALVAAADASADAAAASAAAAAAVGNTNDTIIASRINDPDSATRAAGNAAYAPLPQFPHADGLYAFFPCTPDMIDADGNLWSTEGSYGRAMFTLTEGTPTPTVGDGPFGDKGLLLSVTTPTVWVYGGTTSGTGGGPFDMGPWQKFTILAAVKPTDGTAANLQCVAACHPESGPDQSRQWALYYNQNTNDAPRAGAFHISDRGGASPGETFNYTFGATARAFFNRATVWGATYDGEYLTQVVDGVADEWENATSLPVAPFPRRGNPMRLPWGLLSDPARAKASIGASLEGDGGYGSVNAFGGELYGIWVYNRVLTAEEIARHQIAVAQRMSIPALTLDFMTDNQTSGTSLVADTFVARRGVKSYTGPRNLDTSTSTTNPAWKLGRGSSLGETYASAAHLVRVPDANPGMVYFEIPAGALNTKHLTRMTWRVNSPSGTPVHRVAFCIDHGAGPVWYASATTYSPRTGAVPDGYDWTLALDKELVLKQVAGTTSGVTGWDATKWYVINFDDTQLGRDYGAYVNYTHRPSAETATDWASLNSTGTTFGSSADAFSGAAARLLTFTADATTGTQTSFGISMSGIADFSADPNCAVGSIISASMHVKPSKSQQMLARIVFQNAASAFVGGWVNGTATVCPSTGYTKLDVSTTVPATAVKAQISVIASSVANGGTLWLNGDTLKADGAGIWNQPTAPPTWFDGDSASATWSGVAHQSTSSKSFASLVGGDPITLAAATNTTTLESGDLLAVGFYCPGGSGGVHRIDDIKLWAS